MTLAVERRKTLSWLGNQPVQRFKPNLPHTLSLSLSFLLNTFRLLFRCGHSARVSGGRAAGDRPTGSGMMLADENAGNWHEFVNS